jgi:hypothetical protein
LVGAILGAQESIALEDQEMKIDDAIALRAQGVTPLKHSQIVKKKKRKRND